MKTVLDMLKFFEADLNDPLTEKITDDLRMAYLIYVKRIIELIENEKEN
jgi:hypothetical protein